MKAPLANSSFWYPETDFGGFTRSDGTILFYSRVQSMLPTSGNILDVGCGRGAHIEDAVSYRRLLRDLRGPTRTVIGIDVESSAADNPTIDQFRLLEPEKPWPVSTGSINFVLSDHVIEHLPNPQHFFSELQRVTAEGAIVALRTPNRWGYVALVASAIPSRFHHALLKAAQPQRRVEDTFRTYYRCNRPSLLLRYLSQHGFQGCIIPVTSEPTYLNFSRVAYSLGVLHQRVAPSLLALSLTAFARKLAKNHKGNC